MDKALKQRLLGAAVVTALVVIVVPELVRDPAQPEQAQRNTAPPPPGLSPMASSGGDGSVVISLPGEEMLQAPPTLLSQPQSATLPTAQLPSLPQVPETAASLADGRADEESSPMAAVAVVDPEETGSFQEPPMIPPFLTQEDEAPSQSLPVAASPGEPSPVSPPANNARELAAREAAAKLRGHDISRNRAIALERARLAEERRQATAEALAQERARATRQAQMGVQGDQQPAPAQEAQQRVTRAGPTPPRGQPSPSLPPVEMIGQPAPQSTDTGSWTVQAGSFSQPQYATQLRDRLRSRQFPATVREAQVDGQTLFRVQIGPQPSRVTSEQVLQRMRQEVGINGAVMPLDG